MYTDNEGAHGSFIRGTSDNAVGAMLVSKFAALEVDLGLLCWLERVPSRSNPANEPSRGSFLCDKARTRLPSEMLSEILPGVLWLDVIFTGGLIGASHPSSKLANFARLPQVPVWKRDDLERSVLGFM